MGQRIPTHKPRSHRTKQQRDAVYNATPQRRAHQSLYDHEWRDYSKRRLAEYPFCVECLEEDREFPGAVTDHIRPHKGDPELFRDPNNHQTLCKPHHDRKTAREDGGFGRN